MLQAVDRMHLLLDRFEKLITLGAGKRGSLCRLRKRSAELGVLALTLLEGCG